MPARPYFAALHGLRGLSALLVAVYHFPLPSLVTSSALARGGWLAVDFFFVLSGFLIATLYAGMSTGEERSRFALSRIARLWPAHLAMLAVIFGLELAKATAAASMDLPGSAAPFAGHTSLQFLLANVSLTQAYIGVWYPTWNDPAWSVSAEIGAYTLFAVLTMLPKHWQGTAWTAASVTGLLAILILSPNFMAAPVSLGWFRCAAGFFIGCRLTQLPRLKATGVRATLWEAAALIGCVAFVSSATGAATMMAPFVFAAVVWVFRNGAGPLSHCLASSPLRWLGDISYSLYLVHLPLLIAASGLVTVLGLRSTATGPLLFAYISMSLAAAIVLRQTVELPGTRALKRWLPRALLSPGAAL
jgi:peptidoglycan/LPS O-acetylase OafA/YrhL